MAEYITYTTITGQRWDNVAFEMYGDAGNMGTIIGANPDVPFYDVLPGGLALNIPILPRASIKTNEERLPPWKRTE